ncbi:hypothetical protein ABPG75_004996 [Micractinium tetrahymenae]
MAAVCVSMVPSRQVEEAAAMLRQLPGRFLSELSFLGRLFLTFWFVTSTPIGLPLAGPFVVATFLLVEPPATASLTLFQFMLLWCATRLAGALFAGLFGPPARKWRQAPKPRAPPLGCSASSATPSQGGSADAASDDGLSDLKEASLTRHGDSGVDQAVDKLCKLSLSLLYVQLAGHALMLALALLSVGPAAPLFVPCVELAFPLANPPSTASIDIACLIHLCWCYHVVNRLIACFLGWAATARIMWRLRQPGQQRRWRTP